MLRLPFRRPRQPFGSADFLKCREIELKRVCNADILPTCDYAAFDRSHCFRAAYAAERFSASVSVTISFPHTR